MAKAVMDIILNNNGTHGLVFVVVRTGPSGPANRSLAKTSRVEPYQQRRDLGAVSACSIQAGRATGTGAVPSL